MKLTQGLLSKNTVQTVTEAFFRNLVGVGCTYAILDSNKKNTFEEVILSVKEQCYYTIFIAW